MRKWIALAGLSLTTAVIAGNQLDAQSGQAPIARYAMDVSTASGIMAGGGNPMAAIMGRGGRGGPQHVLALRLGSSMAPSGGGPHADHFMPAGAQLGPSVPLESPVQTAAAAPSQAGDSTPGNFQRPKGRLLLFWGCGAHVGPGQPVVFDFAKMAQGQVPPGLFSVSVPVDRGPTAANSRTFGDWPNGKSRKQVTPASSLVGAHRVAGNYSPDIAFTLDQDFMPAFNARHAAAPDGSTPLSWDPVAGATGYYAWLIGAKEMGGGSGDMVWWTSSARREFGGGLADWLAPAVVTRLIGEKVVLPPSQTSCTIPAEVKAAAGEFMMTQLFAYGPERDFSYPPRPTNPHLPWKLEWTARVRFRSNTSVIIGMPGMADSGGGGRQGADGDPDKPKKPCKPSVLGVLGGRLRC